MREPRSVEWTTSGSHALFMLVTEFIILTANLGTEGAKTAKSMKKGFIVATKAILRVSMVVCFLLCYAVTSAADITNIYLSQPGTLKKYAGYGFSDIKITGAVYASDLSYLASQLRGKYDLKTVDLSEATIELSNNNKDNTYTYFQDGEECADVMLSANSIPESMFEGCIGLKRILLPASLEQIGNRAFLGSSLLVIDIPPSVSRVGRMAFQACPYLKRVYIYGEPMLGRDAFKNTDKLSAVYVESSTPFAIDANAFSNYDFSLKVHNCDAYKNDAIWGKNKHIHSFNNGKLVYASPVTFNLDMPGQLSQSAPWYNKIDIEKISDLKITGKMYASDISWLKSHIIENNTPNSGTLKRLDLSEAELVISDNPEENKIGEKVLSTGGILASVFNDFIYMEYLGLPNGISGISGRSFENTPGPIEISIPKTVEYIDQLAFWNNKVISVVDIKEGDMTSIGGYAFADCSSLISISLPENIETIGYECFMNCTSLRRVLVPFNVDNLQETFYGCTSLEEVRIGHAEKPTTIGDNTFYSCTSLKEVYTISTITNLGRNCFAGCTSLETFFMPASVNEIGKGCFSGCSNLKTVYVTPKEFYASKFDTWHFKDEISVNLLKPYVPIFFGNSYMRYRTFCLKNDVLLSNVPYANLISVYSVKGIANGKVVLSEVTNGVLKGGVAYVVSGGNTMEYSTGNMFGGFTFTLEDGEEPLVENALFQGVYEDTYAPAGSYVLQRDGNFHIVAEDNTIKVGAYHAYLNVPMNTNEPQLVMQFDDGGTTGVDCVTEVEKKTDNRLYDLMGRRVITPQKGHIYVRGNKKIIY